MCGKTCFVSTVVALAAFVAGIGLGFGWARSRQTVAEVPSSAGQSTAGSSAATAPPTGFRLEARKEAEDLLDAAGQTVALLKFSGTDYIKFWGEIENDGRVVEFIEVTSVPFIGNIDTVSRSGDFVWIRSNATGIPGREQWRMTIRGKDQFAFGNMEIDPFRKEGRAPSKSVRPLPAVSQIKIPDPLPVDRAVCLREYREISDGGEQALVELAVNLLGVLATPSVGQFPACALCGAGGSDEICTIRLMCKVIPAQKK